MVFCPKSLAVTCLVILSIVIITLGDKKYLQASDDLQNPKCVFPRRVSTDDAFLETNSPGEFRPITD